MIEAELSRSVARWFAFWAVSVQEYLHMQMMSAAEKAKVATVASATNVFLMASPF